RCACAGAGPNNAAQITPNIAITQLRADPRNSLITIKMPNPALDKARRGTPRQLEEKLAEVKAGFSSSAARWPVIRQRTRAFSSTVRKNYSGGAVHIQHRGSRIRSPRRLIGTLSLPR